MKILKIIIIFLWSMVVGMNLHAQDFVNGDFEVNDIGWDCGSTTCTEKFAGGYHQTNNVGQVDDLQFLCQTIEGLSPDQEYIVEFEASRCKYFNERESPKLFKAVIIINGVAVDTVIRKLPFDFIRQSFKFVADDSTANIFIAPLDRWDNLKCGMVFDNFTITPYKEKSPELIKLRILNNENSILLKWGIIGEVSSNKWKIMRAANNMAWNCIGELNGTKTTDNIVNYQFIDNDPVFGEAFYRLKQINENEETILVSSVVTVPWDEQIEILVNPDSNSDIVTVRVSSLNQYTAAIFDSEGTLIRVIEHVDSGTILNIDVQEFKSGLYYLNLTGRKDFNKRACIPFSVN